MSIVLRGGVHRRCSLILLAASLCFSSLAMAEKQKVYLYNWNDYFAEDTLAGFAERTGIEPVLDVYDANEVLEAKLLAGSSGYDLVFPTARPFAARHIKAGIYRPLDKDQLPGLDQLDPDIMASLAEVDPDNAHLVPYMWGTSGLGLNVEKVRAVLGEDAELDTWGLVFDPDKAAKLADCGISLLDDPTEVFSAALVYLGKDPNSLDPGRSRRRDRAAERGAPAHPLLPFVAVHQRSRDRQSLPRPRLFRRCTAGARACE